MRREITEYTVATVGLSLQEEILLKALVELAPAGAGRKWQFAGSPPAGVVIVDAGTTEGHRYLEMQPWGTVVTLGDAKWADGHHPHLERPVRNQALRELLNRLVGEQQSPAPAAPVSQPKPATPVAMKSAPTTGESVQSRLEKLKQRLANRQQTDAPAPTTREPRPAATSAPLQGVNTTLSILSQLARGVIRHRLRFLSAGGPEFAADPDSDSGFVVGGLQALLALAGSGSFGRIEVERINGRELARFTNRAEQCPLDRLRWYLGMNFSGGGLLDELSDWPAFRLRRWPDFGQLPYRRELARAARHLMTHASTPRQLAAKGGLEAGQVAAFLNAAYLCGWLVRAEEAAPDLEPPRRSPNRSRLIGKLRASLGIK